jgi:hypothetical protein
LQSNHAVARQNEDFYLATSVVGWMPLIVEAFVGTRKISKVRIILIPLPMEVEKSRGTHRQIDGHQSVLVVVRNILAMSGVDRQFRSSSAIDFLDDPIFQAISQCLDNCSRLLASSLPAVFRLTS